jgi:pyruvate,water dikinase
MLQTRVRVGNVKHERHETAHDIGDALSHLPRLTQRILLAMIPTARKAVARRETTKALSIKMVSTVRKGYRILAVNMVEAGLLDDTDQVFFLTHDELGQLLADQNPDWRRKANKRRQLLPELDKLIFDEVCFGVPEPLEQQPETIISAGQLKGIPVSRGTVEGPVRIIETLADADKLQEGEIMVASFTDIGWTPYFSIISGLITEIGSPLSHGAVVAREYGIPAVVGAKGAKQFLTTGVMVRLDGNKGIVEKV